MFGDIQTEVIASVITAAITAMCRNIWPGVRTRSVQFWRWWCRDLESEWRRFKAWPVGLKIGFAVFQASVAGSLIASAVISANPL